MWTRYTVPLNIYLYFMRHIFCKILYSRILARRRVEHSTHLLFSLSSSSSTKVGVVSWAKNYLRHRRCQRSHEAFAGKLFVWRRFRSYFISRLVWVCHFVLYYTFIIEISRTRSRCTPTTHHHHQRRECRQRSTADASAACGNACVKKMFFGWDWDRSREWEALSHTIVCVYVCRILDTNQCPDSVSNGTARQPAWKGMPNAWKYALCIRSNFGMSSHSRSIENAKNDSQRQTTWHSRELTNTHIRRQWRKPYSTFLMWFNFRVVSSRSCAMQLCMLTMCSRFIAWATLFDFPS